MFCVVPSCAGGLAIEDWLLSKLPHSFWCSPLRSFSSFSLVYNEEDVGRRFGYELTGIENMTKIYG